MSSESPVEILKAQVKEVHELWQQEVVKRQLLEAEVAELRASANGMQSGKAKLEILKRRVKTTDTLLGYLKSKARIMAIPRYAHMSCGIKQKEGVGLVDRQGVPMAEWGSAASKICASITTALDHELVCDVDNNREGPMERGDDEYVEHIAMTVMQITEVMEIVLKRALVAESEMGLERERSRSSQEEVRKKALQISSMWRRVEEMEQVAKGTSGMLKQMQEKLEAMETETSQQRQRASDNEQELSRVRHDFGVLRISVDNLIKARETIHLLEKRIHEVEMLSERLTERVLSLESGKRQQEMEIKKLLVENSKLRGALDLKETELSAIGEQVRLISMTPNRQDINLQYSFEF
ncbi:unnamed protein product [Sphagnum jensenii]|uniref:Uncharacterized protein n=1 Tax=Sphagnum jensenii TaxID=128206 RepID=A0ABP1ABH5_9BRYO